MKYKMNDIYNIDNMELMKEFPDNYFDLAIVDPPYGIGESGGKNKSRGKLTKSKEYKDYIGNDEKAPEKEYFDELIRVSKNQIIWGANHFISKIPYDSSCWIVWDKINGKSALADCEMAWTSFKTATRIFRFRWQGMLQGNMKDKEERIHPNQKPVELYNWLLQNYAKKGNKILDTHLGSASSVIAIEQSPLELEYVACDLDTNCFNDAQQRIADFKAQTSMFEEQK